MKKITLITLIFLSILSFGQNSNDKIIFRDSLLNLTDNSNYLHKYIIKNYSEEKEKYDVEKFIKINSEDILEAIYQVNDKNNFILNGFCKIIKDNKIKAIYNYTNNKLIGEYSEFYDNEKLKLEGEYISLNGKDVSIIKNFWDSNGKQTVINFNGSYEILHNNQIPIKGEIKTGLMNGIWTSTNESYPKYEYLFKNNELIEGTIIHSENSKRKFKNNEPSLPKKGMDRFREEISSDLSKILHRHKIEPGQYRFNIQFSVYEDGSLNDIKMKSSKNLNIDFEVDLKNIFNKQDKWNSEISNGIEVKSHKNLPIIIEITY